MKLDDLDRQILAYLQEDGRMPFTRIAKALGVTEGTIRNRVMKLEEEHVVQIVGLVDPHRSNYQAPALIGVSIQPPLIDHAAAKIASLPEVSYLILVSGAFDLMVEVMCRDREHLAGFLTNALQTVPGVQRTQTFMILHTYKMAHGAQPVLQDGDGANSDHISVDA